MVYVSKIEEYASKIEDIHLNFNLGSQEYTLQRLTCLA